MSHISMQTVEIVFIHTPVLAILEGFVFKNKDVIFSIICWEAISLVFLLVTAFLPGLSCNGFYLFFNEEPEGLYEYLVCLILFLIPYHFLQWAYEMRQKRWIWISCFSVYFLVFCLANFLASLMEGV